MTCGLKSLTLTGSEVTVRMQQARKCKRA